MADFYNYYQLLGVPDFSEAETVIEAYHQLFEKIQGNPDAEKLMQILHGGMQILQNAHTKKQYDELLSSVVNLKKDEGFQSDMYKKYGKSSRNPLAADHSKTANWLESRNKIESKPLSKREYFFLVLFSLFYFIAPWIFEKLYWAPYNPNNYMFLSLLFLCNIFISTVLCRLIFRLVLHRFQRSYKTAFSWSTILFFVLFAALPLLMFRWMEIEKKYYFQNAGICSAVDVEMGREYSLVYKYKVQDKLFTQSQEVNLKLVDNKTEMLKIIKIKYAKERPEISEIVNMEEVEKLKEP